MKRPLLIAVLVLACATATAWNWGSVQFLFEHPRLSDFDQFFGSAREFLEGRDLYVPGGLTAETARPLRGLKNMNPPHFVLMMVPLALLPRVWAFSVWMIGGVLGVAVSYWVIAREIAAANAEGRARTWTIVHWLAVLLATLVFAGTHASLMTGNLSLLLLLPVTLAWREGRHGRWNRTAVMLGLCLSVKPFFLIFVPYLVVTRRIRPAVLMLATAAAFVAAGLAICGTAAYVSWYCVMQSFTSWSGLGLNASLQGLFQRLFAPYAFNVPLLVNPVLVRSWVLAATVVGVLTLAMVVRRPQRGPSSVDYAFALLLTAAQLISPLGWVYYMVLPVAPITALVAGAWRMRTRMAWPTWWRGALVAIALAGFFIPIPFSMGLRPTLLYTLTAGSAYCWAVLATWLWLLTDRQPAATEPA